ncbi:hypothetical protein [Methylomagnum ishizawai]|uniref:hypothetical protein n=1 Tax=Methylomagnum ishizawai TaxID=1760988 RepID=UPI001C33BBC8|nr:hypothetical protein [Methylomagnum ishizawai]BBL74173.1 hypothetical protein MishRS11D_12710 [Methylomagnum ishizawai]
MNTAVASGAGNVARRIKYIGSKPGGRRDTVAGTDLHWPGPGAVLVVAPHVAARLVAYPDIWEDVTGRDQPDLLAEAASSGLEVARLREENAQLREEVYLLRQEKALLEERIQRLEAGPTRAGVLEPLAPGANADPPVPETPPIPQVPDLDKMDKRALMEFAQQELQLDLDGKLYPKDMRTQIASTLMARG